MQEGKGKVEKILFRVRKIWDALGKASEYLTLEDQREIRSLVEGSKEKARSQKKDLDVNDKLLFLAERRMKQGFINLELKLEYDISSRMDPGKTREQAIEELYEEETAPT